MGGSHLKSEEQRFLLALSLLREPASTLAQRNVHPAAYPQQAHTRLDVRAIANDQRDPNRSSAQAN